MFVRAGETVGTTAARQERLDRDAIAFTEMPARCGIGTDRVDYADWFVAGDQRIAKIDRAFELSAVLLDIGATDATRLDAQQCVVTPMDVGKRSSSWRVVRLDCGDHSLIYQNLHAVCSQ